jgi:RTX calcium-binding nonapeptide repeat (4 copies)
VDISLCEASYAQSMRIAVVALALAAGFLGPAAGAHAYSCYDVTATMVGTKGNDRLHGTSGRDIIVGLGGDDTIWGLDDADRLCGNGGDDKIIAGAGFDQVDGGSGHNVLKGGSGRRQALRRSVRGLLLAGCGERRRRRAWDRRGGMGPLRECGRPGDRRPGHRTRHR